MMLRNWSMTHPSRYTLKLAAEVISDDPSGPKYAFFILSVSLAIA